LFGGLPPLSPLDNWPHNRDVSPPPEVVAAPIICPSSLRHRVQPLLAWTPSLLKFSTSSRGSQVPSSSSRSIASRDWRGIPRTPPRNITTFPKSLRSLPYLDVHFPPRTSAPSAGFSFLFLNDVCDSLLPYVRTPTLENPFSFPAASSFLCHLSAVFSV